MTQEIYDQIPSMNLEEKYKLLKTLIEEGDNFNTTITVTARQWGTKTSTYEETCQSCNGSGKEKNNEVFQPYTRLNNCSECNGIGKKTISKEVNQDERANLRRQSNNRRTKRSM